ncbi:MAG: helix-turn-helix transcriptional regulator, partial [Dehalococcoidia bacterium]|nr:helix-turn-helix transcriptional regulator [Dehalococcoidia bacterium]
MGQGRGRPPHPDVLTPAEWRVLEQVRAGRANAEIAVRLGISVSTVRYHLGNILGKLELPDRAAMAVWDGEPRRARGWVSLLWVLGRIGSVGRAAVGALAIGGAVVAVALVSSGGGRGGGVA